MHDSTVSAFQIDQLSRSASLRLTSWKHDRSGGCLRITYHEADVVRLESDSEKGLPGPYGFGDLGYDEIEVLAEDLFEHRILFSSGIEIGITFRRLEYEEERGNAEPYAS